MKKRRRGHGVVHNGQDFVIVGGAGRLPIEVCTLSGVTIDCEEREAVLTNYMYYPELFLVTDEFCIDNSFSKFFID